MPKKNQPERAERLAFMEWASLYPNIRKYLIAVENGGSRHPLEAYNLKKCGVIAGPLDYFFMLPSGFFHGMWIEFKIKPNKLTKYQEQFIKTAQDAGYHCVVAWNWEEAVKHVEAYLNLAGGKAND